PSHSRVARHGGVSIVGSSLVYYPTCSIGNAIGQPIVNWSRPWVLAVIGRSEPRFQSEGDASVRGVILDPGDIGKGASTIPPMTAETSIIKSPGQGTWGRMPDSRAIGRYTTSLKIPHVDIDIRTRVQLVEPQVCHRTIGLN